MGSLEPPIRSVEYGFVAESMRPVRLLPWMLEGCLGYQATVSGGFLCPESRLTGVGDLGQWRHMYNVEI